MNPEHPDMLYFILNRRKCKARKDGSTPGIYDALDLGKIHGADTWRGSFLWSYLQRI